MAVTYGDIRKQTLRLLDEYSSRGAIVTSITKIGDIKLKIQGLINDAQYDLAKTKAKIPKVYTFERTAETDATEYDVPADLLEFNYAMVKNSDTERYYHYSSFYSPPTGKIIVSKYLYPFTFDFHYFKRPALVVFTDTDVDDNLTFEVSDDAALIMPYFIVAQILISEGDQTKGWGYLNQYLNMKSDLSGPFYYLGGTIINTTGW